MSNKLFEMSNYEELDGEEGLGLECEEQQEDNECYDECDECDECDEIYEEDNKCEEEVEEAEEPAMTSEEKRNIEILAKIEAENQHEQFISDSEADFAAGFKPKPQEPSQEEMAREFSKFQMLCFEDKVKMMMTVVSEWAVRKGLKVTEIPGTLEQQYEEVCNQKRFESERLFAEHNAALSEAKSKMELEAKIRASKTSQAMHVGQQNAENVARIPRKRNGTAFAKNAPNAKGKLQGEKKLEEKSDKGRQATRREKRETVKPVVVAKEAVVQQIEIEDDDEEEVAQTVPLLIKEQIVSVPQVVSPKVAQAPQVESPKEQDGWTVVPAKSAVAKVAVAKLENKKMSLEQFSAMTKPAPAPRLAPQAPKSLTRTRMCISITSGTKCPHGSRCKFAHSLAEMAKLECGFGYNCRYIKQIGENTETGENTYQNKPGQHTGRTCSCWHPYESEESYAKRMGIKIAPARPTTPATPVVQAPIQLTVVPVVVVPAGKPAKIAPWAKAPAVPKVEAPAVPKVEAPAKQVAPAKQTTLVPKAQIPETPKKVVEVAKPVPWAPKKVAQASKVAETPKVDPAYQVFCDKMFPVVQKAQPDMDDKEVLSELSQLWKSGKGYTIRAQKKYAADAMMMALAQGISDIRVEVC